MSPDGNRLYVIDQANWRVAIIDMHRKAVVNSIATGINPIALCLSPDGKRLFVANSGLFEYRPVSGVQPGHLVENGLRFPPFSYPSPDGQRGIRTNEHEVPALGDANSPAGSSVWSYDVADLRRPQLLAKLRLGQPIRPAPSGVVGGAAPSALASTANHVYVALSHAAAGRFFRPRGAYWRRPLPSPPLTTLTTWTKRAVLFEA